MVCSTIVRELRAAGVDTGRATPVGSLRRFAPDIGDVSLLAVATRRQTPGVIKAFTRLPSVRQVIEEHTAKATVATARSHVTLHVADPEFAGSMLAWLTGSVGHVQQLAALARDQGLRFEQGYLRDKDGSPIACRTEEMFYARLDLPLIAPEIRHGEDEIASAREGKLPDLLTALNIRGDLHMHSTWSDGRDTIEDMVRAGQALGYEYVAITDHSERAWSSRALSVEDIETQLAEIEVLRRAYPRIRILHGIEVDIMPDGTLDFEDDVLARFDIVLASLHDHANHSAAQLLDRYLRAIESPYVDIITHPAGRSPAASPGYDLEFDRLFEAAARTGTAGEVDGAPGHLDMDGALARRAAAAGATVVVDSDCHRVEALGRQMRFGVATARRGWIEPRHVLNTRPVNDVLKFVARKRSRA
jgi:DNA polymerase (family X)